MLAIVMMLSELLGGGTHSLLYRSLRRERQLCYHVGTNVTVLNDGVIFQILAIAHRANAKEVLHRMLEQVRCIRESHVTHETLERCKTRLLHSLDSLEDDSTNLCEWLCHETSATETGRPVTPDYYRQQVESITFDEFSSFAQDALSSTFRTTWVLGGIRFWNKWRFRRILRADTG